MSIWLKFGMLGVKPWNRFYVVDEASLAVGYVFSGDGQVSCLVFAKCWISTRPHPLDSFVSIPRGK